MGKKQIDEDDIDDDDGDDDETETVEKPRTQKPNEQIQRQFTIAELSAIEKYHIEEALKIHNLILSTL